MKQPHPFPGTKMLELVPEKEGFHLYPFIISAFVPRPIGFISSLSKEVRRAQPGQHDLLVQPQSHSTPALEPTEGLCVFASGRRRALSVTGTSLLLRGRTRAWLAHPLRCPLP